MHFASSNRFWLNLRTQCGLPQKFHSLWNSTHTGERAVFLLPPKKKNPTILVYLLFHIFSRRRRVRRKERDPSASAAAAQAKSAMMNRKTWEMKTGFPLISNAAPVNSLAILIFVHSSVAFFVPCLAFPFDENFSSNSEKMGFSVRRTAKSAIEKQKKKCNKKKIIREDSLLLLFTAFCLGSCLLDEKNFNKKFILDFFFLGSRSRKVLWV